MPGVRIRIIFTEYTFLSGSLRQHMPRRRAKFPENAAPTPGMIPRMRRIGFSCALRGVAPSLRVPCLQPLEHIPEQGQAAGVQNAPDQSGGGTWEPTTGDRQKMSVRAYDDLPPVPRYSPEDAACGNVCREHQRRRMRRFSRVGAAVSTV